MSLIKFIYFDSCLAFFSIFFSRRAVDHILHGEFFALYVFPGIGEHSLICRSFSGITGWRWKISAFVHSRPPCRNHPETAGFGGPLLSLTIEVRLTLAVFNFLTTVLRG